MSFICDFCEKPSRARTVCRMITVETREREYEVGPMIYVGSEIVRQVRQCDDCWQRTPEAIAERQAKSTNAYKTAYIAMLERSGVGDLKDFL